MSENPFLIVDTAALQSEAENFLKKNFINTFVELRAKPLMMDNITRAMVLFMLQKNMEVK